MHSRAGYGLVLIVASGSLVALGCSQDPVDQTAAPPGVTDDPVLTFYQDVAWSPAGDWLAVSVREISQRRWEEQRYEALAGTQYDIHLLRPDGSQRRPLTATPDASELWADWAPDGSLIAFASEREGERQLHVVDADGGPATPLGVAGSAPAWSPDGSRLAFTRDVGEHSQVFVARVTVEAGEILADDERQWTREPANHWGPRWSPDGSRLSFYTDRNGSGRDQVVVVRSDGSDERALTDDEHNNFFASWSADGTRVLFTSNRDGPESVWSVDAGGGSLTRVLAGVFFARMSPDGKRLAFISGEFPDSSVYVGDLHGIGPLVAD